MPRPPRPEDLYRLRIATEPRLSPDGRWAVVTLQTVAPTYDAYLQALWLVPTDAEVVIDTLDLTAEEAAQEIYIRLEKEGYIGAEE